MPSRNVRNYRTGTPPHKKKGTGEKKRENLLQWRGGLVALKEDHGAALYEEGMRELLLGRGWQGALHKQPEGMRRGGRQ